MKRLFYALLIMLMFVSPCLAGPKAKKQVKKGNLLYNNNKFEQALKEYEGALADLPDSDVVNFNTGNALYKTGKYSKSIGHYEKALVSEDESLEHKSSYNIGNAKYKFGIGFEESNLAMAVDLLKQSLRHYERAMELDTEDEDAKFNYEFVKKELERLQEKMEKQQQEPEQQEEQEKQESDERKAQSQQFDQQEKEGKGQSEDKDKEEEKEQSGQDEVESQEAEQKESQGEDSEGREQQTAQMLENEALMLLDSYHDDEEPKGMYKQNIPVSELPPVLKDW